MQEFERLVEIMRTLRDPDRGCPWDLEQDFASIAPCTIEEAYEVAEAIRLGDFEGLREELGDLLLQVVFHARMAEEAGHFAIGGVIEGLCEKLVRRHPHVFGDAAVTDAAAARLAWEEHKAAERAARGGGALDGVARALPALSRAEKLQRRAARAGAPEVPAAARAQEVGARARRLAEAGRGDAEREVGALLFAVVDLARQRGVDAEGALREAAARFEAAHRSAPAGLPA
jgi:MazG family protein